MNNILFWQTEGTSFEWTFRYKANVGKPVLSSSLLTGEGNKASKNVFLNHKDLEQSLKDNEVNKTKDFNMTLMFSMHTWAICLNGLRMPTKSWTAAFLYDNRGLEQLIEWRTGLWPFWWFYN